MSIEISSGPSSAISVADRAGPEVLEYENTLDITIQSMAVETFFASLLDQQMVSGGIKICPAATAAADVYLAGGATVTADAVFIVSDMSLVWQLSTRQDLAIAVCV